MKIYVVNWEIGHISHMWYAELGKRAISLSYEEWWQERGETTPVFIDNATILSYGVEL